MMLLSCVLVLVIMAASSSGVHPYKPESVFLTSTLPHPPGNAHNTPQSQTTANNATKTERQETDHNTVSREWVKCDADVLLRFPVQNKNNFSVLKSIQRVLSPRHEKVQHGNIYRCTVQVRAAAHCGLFGHPSVKRQIWRTEDRDSPYSMCAAAQCSWGDRASLTCPIPAESISGFRTFSRDKLTKLLVRTKMFYEKLMQLLHKTSDDQRRF
ncbi:hypothetical protein EXN66_Car013891 [Channa argus]|uniref:Uncharacterized protein n=1 Tax=Channa argus TaxID=215402 RepID=A0A6G1Q6E8_CHAAH|nr:hypothetical protein EXN66_Car013891 [Channa argus]